MSRKMAVREKSPKLNIPGLAAASHQSALFMPDSRLSLGSSTGGGGGKRKLDEVMAENSSGYDESSGNEMSGSDDDDGNEMPGDHGSPINKALVI